MVCRFDLAVLVAGNNCANQADLQQQLTAARSAEPARCEAAKTAERERRELIAEWRQLRSQQGAVDGSSCANRLLLCPNCQLMPS